MTIEAIYSIFEAHPSVQTDTRLLQKGDLFFALRGPNFNGNHFVQQALEAGAAYCIADDPALSGKDERIIVVEDVLSCLQQLAKHHRQQFTIPFIAITGSNGKTTSKELVSQVLSARYITYTTQGNLNNHIGIPLTILRVKKDAEMAVIEMGANHQKEIAGYCTYCLPTHGIITNCGKAHLEGFGGVEGVRKGKGELYDFLRGNEGCAFVMWDYDYLQTMSRGIPKIITYGTSKDVWLCGHLLNSEPYLQVKIEGSVILDKLNTQLVGDYNLPNVLLAVAIGKYFDVPEDAIKKAIENYAPGNSRSQLIEMDTNKVILDAYNANPSSMRAAIENFAHLQVSPKILMLGAMAELGEESLDEHQQIIDLIKKHPWKEVVLVGGDFLKLEHPFRTFNNSADAGAWFRDQHFTQTHILVKGSRSMQMEKSIGK